MSEPTPNPPPAYSSYLTQQQLVSDVNRLRQRIVDLELQMDALAATVKSLKTGVTEFPAAS